MRPAARRVDHHEPTAFLRAADIHSDCLLVATPPVECLLFGTAPDAAPDAGNPDDLHEVRATHQRGDITLTDTRLVKVSPGAIMDSDGDGLPDYWENQNGLDPNNPDGVEGNDGDIDGDGVNNLMEFLADFNPADPNDGHLLNPVISPTGNTWRLRFPVIPNRLYQIESSTEFAVWTNLGSGFTVATANPAYQWTAPVIAGPQRFYRVRISLP